MTEVVLNVRDYGGMYRIDSGAPLSEAVCCRIKAAYCEPCEYNNKRGPIACTGFIYDQKSQGALGNVPSMLNVCPILIEHTMVLYSIREPLGEKRSY